MNGFLRNFGGSARINTTTENVVFFSKEIVENTSKQKLFKWTHDKGHFRNQAICKASFLLLFGWLRCIHTFTGTYKKSRTNMKKQTQQRHIKAGFRRRASLEMFSENVDLYVSPVLSNMLIIIHYSANHNYLFYFNLHVYLFTWGVNEQAHGKLNYFKMKEKIQQFQYELKYPTSALTCQLYSDYKIFFILRKKRLRPILFVTQQQI